MKENLYTPGLNAAQIWAKLNLQYQLQTEEQLHLLWQQYYDFKHTAGTFSYIIHFFSLLIKFLSLTGDDMRTMIQKLSNIADQLREREQILPEVQLVSKALATLPENFRIVRTVWTSLPANDRTLDHLLQRLITEESVLKSYQTKTEHNNEAAFTSRQRFNSGRGGSGRERHGVQGGFVDKRPRCGHCNSPTHEEKVCFQKHGYPPNWNTTKRGRGRGRGGGNPPNSSNALLSLSNLDPRSILTFLVDSGASKHMSDQRSFFTTFKPIEAGTWSVKGK